MKKTALANVLETIFPNFTCLVCRGEINKSAHPLVCDACAELLPFHKKACTVCGCDAPKHVTVCGRCQRQGEWHFDRARSAFSYGGVIKELVLRLKYGGEGDIAGFAANFLADAVRDYNIRADVIIPVPLAPKRYKQRGYNQAGLIASELGKIIGVPVICDFLVRTKHTTAQKKMTPEERQENLRGAFEIVPPHAAIKGKRVLLIDDVFTTGTTVDECARAIKRAKPKSIEALTIAGVSQIAFARSAYRQKFPRVLK